MCGSLEQDQITWPVTPSSWRGEREGCTLVKDWEGSGISPCSHTTKSILQGGDISRTHKTAGSETNNFVTQTTYHIGSLALHITRRWLGGHRWRLHRQSVCIIAEEPHGWCGGCSKPAKLWPEGRHDFHNTAPDTTHTSLKNLGKELSQPLLIRLCTRGESQDVSPNFFIVRFGTTSMFNYSLASP